MSKKPQMLPTITIITLKGVMILMVRVTNHHLMAIEGFEGFEGR